MQQVWHGNIRQSKDERSQNLKINLYDKNMVINNNGEDDITKLKK